MAIKGAIVAADSSRTITAAVKRGAVLEPVREAAEARAHRTLPAALPIITKVVRTPVVEPSRPISALLEK
jgi:hypothetical protein